MAAGEPEGEQLSAAVKQVHACLRARLAIGTSSVSEENRPLLNLMNAVCFFFRCPSRTGLVRASQ